MKTDEEAFQALERDVPRGTLRLLEAYVGLLRNAAREQNLVASSTLATIWSRHILDSAQLVEVSSHNGTWVDVGSGAGLPGIVTAILTNMPTILVEPRAKRCEFLRHVVDQLGIVSRVEVVQSRVEGFNHAAVEVITARAVAPLGRLFQATVHLADSGTTWLLPKGRSAMAEVTTAAEMWHATITMVRSVTDETSSIVVARDVRLRTRT